MREEELMLGNHVLDGKRIVVIDRQDVGEELYVFYRPLQLTEEILLMCKEIIKHPTIENRYLLKDSNYSFHIEDGDWEHPSLDIFCNGMYLTCVEHVHEFQNTMFWLIRKQLGFNL